MSNLVYEQVDDLKKIKKEYGEEMSHLCRDLFSTILENKGLLYYLLSTYFAKSKELYNDIIKEDKMGLFKNYIYFYYDKMRNEEDRIKSSKSVIELLKEVGYTLYECKTHEDILKFRKYYTKNEALCTFTDPNRINNHYIYFIVKEDADKLDRNLFVTPKREDEYSLSVLDLQFDKGRKQRVSIKSRYNHSVANPDATYSNNLENIAEGLTEAFEREYGFNIGEEYKVNFELDGYVQARDNKFYKYNYEINNIHYCPDNIIIDNGEVIDKYSNKSRYTFMDYFILDEKNKKIIVYDKRIRDSFVDGLKNITNIEIINEEGSKKIILKLEEEKELVIKLDRLGRIIGYENKYLEKCGDKFLYYNELLQELNLPSLKECGDFFLNNNINLQELNLFNLEKCGYGFLYCNNNLEFLNLSNLEKCGDYFLSWNELLQKLNLPSLKKCGYGFLYCNKSLRKLYLPNLQECGSRFLYYNESLQEFNLSSLKECGNFFLKNNINLQELSLPNLRVCGGNFLYSNKFLKELYLPNLQECGADFLHSNKLLRKLYLPNLQKCGSDFLCSNILIHKLYLPNLQECGVRFLERNESLQELDLPKLKECGSSFIAFNEILSILNLPNLERCGDSFLSSNKSLQKLNLPSLERCGCFFLYFNESLQEINLPSLEYYNSGFISRFGELIEVGKKR